MSGPENPKSTYDKSTGSVKVSSLAGSLGAVSIFDKIFTLGNDNLSIDDNVADFVLQKIVQATVQFTSHASRDRSKPTLSTCSKFERIRRFSPKKSEVVACDVNWTVNFLCVISDIRTILIKQQ